MHTLHEDDIDFDHYLQETDTAAKVRPASAYLGDVMHVLAPAVADTTNHARLPFTNSPIEFPPGQVTAMASFNGSGKSTLTSQLLTGFAREGQRVCIANFEAKPAQTLARIVRQEFGTATPNKDQVAAFLRETDGNIWVFDQQGQVKPERMIAVIRHCAEKLKCKHISVDSLMKCVRGTDDYNAQKDFVDALTSCARDYGIHVHLIVHLKKGDGDERLPTRLDISGTAAISDLVDNVLILWRNKKKERDRDAGKQVDESHPDALLICDKNRHGNWEGRVKLWYDPTSLRFFDHNKNLRRGIARNLD